MGYGGTGYATVSVDIVQTDVDAIVQGLTGPGGQTLTELEWRLMQSLDYLSGYSYGPITDTASSCWGMRDLLSGYYSGPLTETAWNTGNARDYLAGYSGGPLTDIRDYMAGSWGGPLTEIRDNLYIDGYSAAWWLREIQYRGSDILMYLSGGWNGPITDTAWGISTIRDCITGYSYSPLTDMRDMLGYIDGKLYSGYWGASAADLLGDIRSHMEAIRWQTDQLTFDGNGNLRVVTY
jgi:hypothetical protein